MPTTAELHAALLAHCLVNDVALLPRGHTRIGTKLSYIDGSGIDIFIAADGVADDAGYTLTDLGQTFAKLAEYQVKPKDRLEMVYEATASLGVRQVHDRLLIPVVAEAAMTQAIIDLAQACARVSCLAFTKRATKKRAFADHVKTLFTGIRGRGFDVEEGYDYPGPFGRPVGVDYRVTRRDRRPAAVLTLGPTHAQANEVFRKWHDLSHSQSRGQDRFMTIYDDTREPERADDLARLEGLSQVVGASNEGRIAELLAAA